MVLKGGGFVFCERERDLWWGGMVCCGNGVMSNGETVIGIEFQLDYSDNCCFGFERSRWITRMVFR